MNMRTFTYKPLVAAVTMLAMLLMTGLFDTSVALASSVCDTDKFEGFALSSVDGRTTYAVTKVAMPWQEAQNLAKASGGRLAVVSSEAQAADIVAKLSSQFGPVPAPSSGNKAWIGMLDPQKTPTWSVEGSGVTNIMPERFQWDGATNTYTNFAQGQPDGYCTPAEKLLHPDRVCYGENYVAMGQDGKWYDEGDHGPVALALKGVVEWPNTILDCVKAVTPPTVIPVQDFPESDAGATYCSDQTKTSLAKCVKTADGGSICPQDKLPCTDVLNPPVCPSGSKLNTDRDMCQADHITVACPSGYKWDGSVDRCVVEPQCPNNSGVFNPLTDRCEAKIGRTCPANYKFDEAFGVCQKAVECPANTVYSPLTDRCEVTIATSCPANYTFSLSTSRCEKQPECVTNTEYSKVYNTCIAVNDAVCPVGYNWVSGRGRCEKIPECPPNTTYDFSTNKCNAYVAAETYTAIGCTPQSFGCTPSASSCCHINISCPSGPEGAAVVNASYCCLGSDSITISDPSKLTVWTELASTGYPLSAIQCDSLGNCKYYFIDRYCSDGSPASDWGIAGSFNSGVQKAKCPEGTALINGTQCLSATNPTCTGGSFDGVADVCFTTPLPCATNGTTLDTSLGKCVAPAVCTSGSLNAGTDVCQVEPACASGYFFSVVRNRCELAPVPCPAESGSSYSTVADKCAKPATACESGYTWSTARSRCEKAVPDCVAGTSYIPSSDRCEATPTCSEGVYSPDTNVCLKVEIYDASKPVTFNAAIPIGLNGSNVVYAYGSETSFSLPTKLEVNTKEVGPFASEHYTGSVAVGTNTVTGAGYVVQCQRGKDLYVDPYYQPTSSCGESDMQAAGCTSLAYYSCGYESLSPTPTGWGCGWGHATQLGYNVFAACTNTTEAILACPNGGDISGPGTPATCTKTTPSAAVCPPGTELDHEADKCFVSPSCPVEGSVHDKTNDVCYYGASVCGQDWTFDSTISQCTQVVTCPQAGLLDGVNDVCYRDANPICPAGTNMSNGACVSDAQCTGGSFVASRDRCEALVVSECSTSYSVSPLDNSICTAAPICPTDAASPQNATIAFSPSIDRCVAMPEHTCGPSLTWMSLPVNKCEAVPICDPGVYSNTANACSSGSCPSGGACSQIVGDTTLKADGTPMTYCSPNPCQSDTESMMIYPDDVDPMGANDLTDDGARDADGNCAGQIYIFNGRDMRCTKDDIRGMIGSIAKIVAAIVLSVVTAGMGAALFAAMSGVTLAAGTAAYAVANAIFTSIVTSVVSLAIDAATIGIQPGWLMQAGISVMTSAAMAYFSPAVTSTTNNADGTISSTTKEISSASGKDIMDVSSKMTQSSVTIETTDSFTEHFTSEVTMNKDMFGNEVYKTQDVFITYSANGGATKTVIDSSLTVPQSTAGLWALQAQQTANDFAPAISAGMMASYSTKKCCYPDKVAPSCTSSEFEEWSLAAKGNCHKIGTYCDTKFLGMCMAHKETSCCFASKLARIFHEQGRPQLQSFGVNGGWGSVKSPKCRGFTPDEFQMLDMGQMDLSEYIADISNQVSNMAGDIQSYMQNVSSGSASRAEATMAQ